MNSFKIQLISFNILIFCCRVLTYLFPERRQAEQLVLIRSIRPSYDITDSFITWDVNFFPMWSALMRLNIPSTFKPFIWEELRLDCHHIKVIYPNIQ